MLARLLCGLAFAFVALGAAAQAPLADNPALWTVSGPKGKVYLFGSFHLLPPEVNWRTPALSRALEESATIVFETDVAGANAAPAMQQLIAKHGMLPPGDTLRGLLSEKANAEFERVANELGVPPAGLAPMRPWLAALVLGVQFVVKQGYDPARGVEQQLAAWAKQNGKALGALESAEAQIRVFADLTREQEIGLLQVTLRQLREMSGMLGEILAAYRKGDMAALQRTLHAGFDELPALRGRVLGDRHRRWLPQLEIMLATGGSSVVVVGAAHLAGPDSVVAMLRAKGYRVDGP
jgi:uncharacterized protein YbaP (TraB family)